MPGTSAKVAIVGAGSVGSTIAYACLQRGTARAYALFDLDGSRAEAQALDLDHGLEFVEPAAVEGSDDIAVCSGADVVVITAGAAHKVGQTRLDLAATNTAILSGLLPRLLDVAPEAIYVLVSNPVDVLVEVALRQSGLPRERVIGSGTVLDSSRFRFQLARRCGVAVGNVHAYIVGEHGDSEIPLWSSATIGGVPLSSWAGPGQDPMTEADRASIVAAVRDAGYRILAGKGATNFAIGLSTARILDAILGDERAVLPVSTHVDGEHGVDGVSLSLPCVVHRGGADRPLPVPLDAGEQAGLRASGQVLAEVLASVLAQVG